MASRVRVARRAALACPTARTGKRPLSIGARIRGVLSGTGRFGVPGVYAQEARRKGEVRESEEPSRRCYTTTRSRSGRKSGGPEPAHERAGERRAGGPVGVEGRVVDRHLDAGDTAGSRRGGE